MEERLYLVFVQNIKTKEKVYMTTLPRPHENCMRIIKMITRYPWRMESVEEVNLLPGETPEAFKIRFEKELEKQENQE